MELEEAKLKFIHSWGVLGSQWGINRTMAQIHSLLWVSPEALSAENVMEQLSISRGNANMNLRALIDWGLVEKVIKPGERKEFFVAEKDVWEVARKVMVERKRRELAPVIKVLNECKDVEGDPNDPEVKQFKETVESVNKFVNQLDKISDRLISADENWFFSKFLKLIK